MKKLLFACLVLAMAGCSGDPLENALRFEAFGFGSTRTGLQTENPALKPGELVWLNFKVYGATPDKSGNCQLDVSLSVEGTDKIPLPEAGPLTFPKRSSVTHYDFGTKFQIPADAPEGNYKLKAVAEDKVAHDKVEHVVPFSIKK